MRKFQVGDKVLWCGVEGTVIDVFYGQDMAVSVYFGRGHGVKHFTEDGRSKPYYMASSLTLIGKDDDK